MAAPGWRDRRDAVDSKAAFEKREKRRNIRRLQEAIEARDLFTIKDILSKEFDVDFRYRGQTALQLAVRLGAAEICKLLIERGASVNEADGELNSLLNNACWNGYENIAELLIRNDANLDFENDAGSTPLHACAKKGHAGIAALLVGGKRKCNLNVPDRLGRTAALVAARAQNIEALEVLVRGGADLDWGDQHYKTPLIVAAELGYVDIVRSLLRGGANCNKQDNHGHTALLAACMNNHLTIVEALLQYHADTNLPATKGSTPLLEAVRNNNLEMAQLLLDAGCDINLVDRMHHAPIHEAIRQVAQYFDPDQSEGTIKLVRRLVSAGADLNIGDNQGWRPIYQTAYGRNYELTELLLKSGADLAVSTDTGDSVMHGAVYGNSLTIVNMLIRAGCSVNRVNNDNQNPLLAGIVARSDIKILSALVEAGTDLNLPERSAGRTPLLEAIHQYYNEAALLLIDSGCDLLMQNRERQSPLCLASQKGVEAVVVRLLSVLPQPLVFTTLSAIPAHAAAKQGHAHILELLVEGGCDINQLNIEGLTPLQVAVTEDHFPAARRLLQLGCDPDAHAKVTRLQKCCLVNEDPHPHFALEPLFLALTHRNIDLIRILMQCYVAIPFKVIRLLKAVLKTSRELTSHYDNSMKRDLVMLFNVSQPLTLQDTCRRRIRTHLGCPVQAKVAGLPMAEKLKNYIAMAEVFDGWDESDRIEEELRVKPAAFGWRGSTHN